MIELEKFLRAQITTLQRLLSNCEEEDVARFGLAHRLQCVELELAQHLEEEERKMETTGRKDGLEATDTSRRAAIVSEYVNVFGNDLGVPLPALPARIEIETNLVFEDVSVSHLLVDPNPEMREFGFQLVNYIRAVQSKMAQVPFAVSWPKQEIVSYFSFGKRLNGTLPIQKLGTCQDELRTRNPFVLFEDATKGLPEERRSELALELLELVKAYDTAVEGIVTFLRAIPREDTTR